MTDFQFLDQLKQHLLHFEQVLVCNDLKEIEETVRTIQQFIYESKLNPPTESGEHVRSLAEEIHEVMQRNQVLIREGLLVADVFMQSLLNHKPVTTSNYQRTNHSADIPSHTPSQRIFDARV